MPVIVPVRDLKDTNRISELCNREKRPVFITKNGYGDMVIMSMSYYEDAGRVKPLRKVIARQRAKLNVHA